MPFVKLTEAGYARNLIASGRSDLRKLAWHPLLSASVRITMSLPPFGSKRQRQVNSGLSPQMTEHPTARPGPGLPAERVRLMNGGHFLTKLLSQTK